MTGAPWARRQDPAGAEQEGQRAVAAAGVAGEEAGTEQPRCVLTRVECSATSGRALRPCLYWPVSFHALWISLWTAAL